MEKDPALRPERRVGSHDWGRMEWLVEEASAPGAGMSLALMYVNPGAAAPAHRHPNANESVTLLEGTLEQTVEGRAHVLEPGETLYVPAGAVHGVRNPGSREARAMVAYSTGTRLFEPAPQT
ncbi:MAG TPA: cupin domain-containing protein [bacterium]|nr:cupin domain-containing protein [bacterium]